MITADMAMITVIIVGKPVKVFAVEKVEVNHAVISVLTLLVHSKFLLAVFIALLIVEATLDKSEEFSSKNVSN